jgi:hypothetical protein
MPGDGKRGSHLFASKAQWRWAWATRQPWARRHAEANETARPYKTLPTRLGVRKKT